MYLCALENPFLFPKESITTGALSSFKKLAPGQFRVEGTCTKSFSTF